MKDNTKIVQNPGDEMDETRMGLNKYESQATVKTVIADESNIADEPIRQVSFEDN